MNIISKVLQHTLSPWLRQDPTILPQVGIDLVSSHPSKKQLERYLNDLRNARDVGIALVLAIEFEDIINGE